MKRFPALNLSDVVFIMLINVKMVTIVGISTFKSRIKFVLSSVEHGKKFYNLGVSVLLITSTVVLFAIHKVRFFRSTVKPVLSGHSKRRPKIEFQDRLLLNAGQKYCRMLSWSILQYF